jgi:hypothetical protein
LRTNFGYDSASTTVAAGPLLQHFAHLDAAALERRHALALDLGRQDLDGHARDVRRQRFAHRFAPQVLRDQALPGAQLLPVAPDQYPDWQAVGPIQLSLLVLVTCPLTLPLASVTVALN